MAVEENGGRRKSGEFPRAAAAAAAATEESTLLIETKERKIAVETSERMDVCEFRFVSFRIEVRDLAAEKKNISILVFSPLAEIRRGIRRKKNRLSRALICAVSL